MILINNKDHEITKELTVWYLGVPRECTMKQLMLTTAEGYSTEEKEYPVVSGKVTVTLPATSAIILRHEDHILKNFLQFG